VLFNDFPIIVRFLILCNIILLTYLGRFCITVFRVFPVNHLFNCSEQLGDSIHDRLSNFKLGYKVLTLLMKGWFTQC
jgi:hypothetical protein